MLPGPLCRRASEAPFTGRLPGPGKSVGRRTRTPSRRHGHGPGPVTPNLSHGLRVRVPHCDWQASDSDSHRD
eukprot:721901-Rhodomonas_salina.3